MEFRKRTFIGPDGRRYRWDMYNRDVAVSDRGFVGDCIVLSHSSFRSCLSMMLHEPR